MDLAEFDDFMKRQEDGLLVEILHPATGAPLGITIRVAGPDSAHQRAVRRQMVDARLESGRGRIKAAEAESEARLALAKNVLGWDGVVYQGRPLEFTIEHAEAIFKRFPFIADQVDAKAGSRAAFFQTQSKSSATQSESASPDAATGPN